MKTGMALLPFQPSQPSQGNSIQVANVVKDLGVLIDLSFSPSVHCKEAASKARRMLFMIRRSFAELSVSAYAPLYNTLVRLHLEYAMQACSSGKSSFSTRVKLCCRRRLFGANPAVGDEARKGFPSTAMWGTTTSAGSTFLTQGSPPHSRIQIALRRIGSGPQPLFYSASATWLEGSSFQGSAGS